MPSRPNSVHNASAIATSSTSALPTATAYTDADVESLAAQLTPAHLTAIAKEKVSQTVIYYVVDRVFDAVDRGLGRPRRRHSPDDSLKERRAFAEFVTNVFRRAEVSMSAVLGSLVYIDRALPYLSIAVAQWAQHRVLLGALIVASKYLNDASLKNAHWAVCTSVFGRNDIARIEREFLIVLDFELWVKEQDLQRASARMILSGAIRMPKAPSVPKQKVEIVDEPMVTEQQLSSMAPFVAVEPALPEAAKNAGAIRREKERQRRMVSGRGDFAAASTTRPRPEKRHSDVEMDMDLDSDHFARRIRRRQEKERAAHRRTEVYLPSIPRSSANMMTVVPVARSNAPTTIAASSPASDDGSSSSCSSCASSALSAAGSRFPSPTTPASSPDGNSPYTPPSAYPHRQSQLPFQQQPQYSNLKPLHLLERFPHVPVPPVPVPTPVSASAPQHQRSHSVYALSQAPPALPSLPPFPALPLNLDAPISAPPMSRPPSSVAYNLYPPSYRAATMAA